ncbi:hypothetical protein [Bizionia psychrotolerans]|uniref:hypothetical protein n=1 Tax=Bizionia psychrotolerans TaxID=1492901 RepID=UPI00065022C6|nr:hypothetical protein [Bizionia psychrotolerans]
MYKSIICSLIFLSTGCSQTKTIESETTQDVALKTETEAVKIKEFNGNPLFISDPYDLEITIEKTENNNYELVTEIILKNDSYFVSPHSTVAYKGRFSSKLQKSNHVKMVEPIVEIPRSVEEIDPHPFVDGPVNWVRENTTYRQPLVINTNSDFEVSGLIKFTIEPRCSLEKIGYTINHKDGEMTVKVLQGCQITELMDM